MPQFLQNHWQAIVSHWHEITFVVSLSSLFLWLYRTFANNETQQKNHDALSSWIGWGARAGWLDLLQSAVRWALRAVAAIYGPINESATSWSRQFLTPRAWRMSAWISSLYLFVLLPIGLSVTTAAWLVSGRTLLSADAFVAPILCAAIAGGLLAVH